MWPLQQNFSGSKADRQQSVHGCVLCSIAALTDWGGKKGRKREGVKEEMGGKRSGLILGGFKILEGEL